MAAALRCEIFPADLDATVAFYVSVTGVELVLEVDDLDAEHARVTAAGWPLAEDRAGRPWGLRDFRLLDPSGYYWRITSRAPHLG
jgi:catechol 2,3-dioxygenase-like lactoylglutathione lyase family enzyme